MTTVFPTKTGRAKRRAATTFAAWLTLAACSGPGAAGGTGAAAETGANAAERACTVEGQVPNWVILGSGAIDDETGRAFWAVTEIPVANRSSSDAHRAAVAEAKELGRHQIVAQLDAFRTAISDAFRKSYGDEAVPTTPTSHADEETLEILARFTVVGVERATLRDRWQQPDRAFGLTHLPLQELYEFVDPGERGGHPLQRFLRQHGDRVFAELAARHLEKRRNGPFGACLRARQAKTRVLEGWAEDDAGPWCGGVAPPADFERITPLANRTYEVRRGSTPQGELVTTLQTDARGQFQIELAQGAYCVTTPGSSACLAQWKVSPRIDALVIQTGYNGPGCGDALYP